MANNTALLITLLYWPLEFKGGGLTFADFYLHAFQVRGTSVVDPNSFFSDSDPQIIFFGFGFGYGFGFLD
jgi:hypothetical protein